MQKGNLIAQGGVSEVYFWGEKTILKLFKEGVSKHDIENEFKLNEAIRQCGLFIPQAIQIIEQEGRWGIIFEKAEGEPMLERILKNYSISYQEGRRLAEIHYKIHQCRVGNLPRQKEVFERRILKTDLLSNKKKYLVLKILMRLPERYAVCHNDFHPGNVILNLPGEMIIDWADASGGNPAADVAKTLFLLKYAVIPGSEKNISAPFRDSLYSRYLERYLALSGIAWDEITLWEVPVAAARLSEGVSKIEEERLMELVEKGIQ
jgi:uncharacterized protein (TIGR02172 family)